MEVGIFCFCSVGVVVSRGSGFSVVLIVFSIFSICVVFSVFIAVGWVVSILEIVVGIFLTAEVVGSLLSSVVLISEYSPVETNSETVLEIVSSKVGIFVVNCSILS